MPETRECSFCGERIEPGTGKMFVKRDGTIYRYCSNKCQKSHMDLDRVPREVRWSRHYEAPEER